jgi:hypothetical protein
MKKARPTKKSSGVRDEPVEYKRWKHPGGKLRELGPQALSNIVLLFPDC